MYPHHQQTLERLRQRFETDSAILALLIIGSVARGDARADSDVDCLLVVTDEEYDRREAAGALDFTANELCDPPGGQAGGAAVTLEYLEAAAARGTEPTRFAFTDAGIVFSRMPELGAMLHTIPVYQEHERTEKLASFVSQLPVHLSYMALGEYSGNPYLLAETAVELVLFGGRLILGHNRMLYPGRKLLLREIERAPEKPEGLMTQAHDLLRRPGIATAHTFASSILEFAPWPQPREGVMTRFRRDRERIWLTGLAPLSDR